MLNYLIGLVLSIPGLILALSMHEFAHGYAAYKMGDSTAKYNGRLSINPFDHLDPIGTLCLFLFHFGWAKPVPINPYNFKNQRLGMIVVSLAGPFMNFILAIISAFALTAVYMYMPFPTIGEFLSQVLLYSVYLNVGLMVFNLIPIPPLDGSKVLFEFLPYRYRQYFYQLERYGSIILVLFIVGSRNTGILTALQGYVLTFINFLVGLVF